MASQDGKLRVVDALQQRQQSIDLTSSWVMCCDINPPHTLVASGGLDNIVALYGLPIEEGRPTAPDVQMTHDGYVGETGYSPVAFILALTL